jgi:hypothetical protein
MALRTSSISSFLRRASATTVVLFLDPSLRPAFPFWNGRPRRRGASGGMISDFFELIGVQPNHTHRSYSDSLDDRSPSGARALAGTAPRHRVNPAYLREWCYMSSSAPDIAAGFWVSTVQHRQREPCRSRGYGPTKSGDNVVADVTGWWRPRSSCPGVHDRGRC